ncbi:MAG: hypothetical protein LAO31_15025 [Acidobacteriia bacterium]|nr:hypothetical protein [Terriglobia bacterium]
MKTGWPQLRKRHRYQWVIDSLCEQPTFFQKRMFGSEACYLHGRLVLALTSGADEPWRGILVPTAKIHHRSLLQEFVGLRVHPVLRKWLYLPEDFDEFEGTANSLIERILANDIRIGVESPRSSR